MINMTNLDHGKDEWEGAENISKKKERTVLRTL
jgi:hypothetical protein